MASQIKQPSTEPFFKLPREFKKRGPNGFPIGPRTRERQKQNAKLNKLPDSVKKVCEIRIEGVCAGNRMLTWSHALKSRFLVTDLLWQRAARSCLPCHMYCEEKMSKKQRADTIDAAIKRRKHHGQRASD
jgi:hypothetical protein